MQDLQEKDKQTQLNNEMNIQKINDLETHNENLNEELKEQTDYLTSMRQVYDFETQKQIYEVALNGDKDDCKLVNE